MKARFIFLLTLAGTVFLPWHAVSQSVNTYGHADNVVLRNYAGLPGHAIPLVYVISFATPDPQIDTIADLGVFLFSNHHALSYGAYPAVYSDRNGEFKLYALPVHPPGTISQDYGTAVWNGNLQIIDTLGKNLSPPHGSGLAFPVVAAPMPGSPDLIYLFQLIPNGICSSVSPYNIFCNTLYWSLIDLSGNGGHGSVVFDSQVFSSDTMQTHSLALTKHANGKDYWLLSRKYMTREYVAYHIQPGGVVDTVRSEAGLEPKPVYSKYFHHGPTFDFSPNGRWLADNITEIKHIQYFMGTDTLQLLNFDATTGVVSDSNARYVPKYDMVYGVGGPIRATFSPDSRYLYAWQQEYESRLYQYDLQAPDQQFFVNSGVMLQYSMLPGSSPTQQPYWYDMFTAPNGKIYSRTDFCWPSWGVGFHSVESPNTGGIGCQMQDTSFLITSNPVCNYNEYYFKSRFPKFVSSWLKEPLGFSYSSTCAGEGSLPTHFAFTDSVVDAFWSFGDTLAMGADTSDSFFPTYNYTQPGDYHVWAKALSYGMWDSISKVITVHPPPQVSLGPDTSFAGSDTLVLDPGAGYLSYAWSTGDSTQTITLYGSQLSPGDYMYFVEVTDTNGCTGTGWVMVTRKEDTTSIVRKAQKPLWEVYPNPCGDKLHVNLKQTHNLDQVRLRLYSPEGKMLKEKTVQTTSLTLDMAAYSNGVYWLQMTSGKKVRTERVVKTGK